MIGYLVHVVNTLHKIRHPLLTGLYLRYRWGTDAAFTAMDHG